MMVLAAIRFLPHWRGPAGGLNWSGLFGLLVVMAIIYGAAYAADVLQLGTGLRRLRGGLPVGPRELPFPGQPGTAVPSAPAVAGFDWRQSRERLFGGDFSRVIPLPAESRALALQTPPIADGDVQRFLVWRRSSLFVAGVCLSARVADDLFGRLAAWWSSDTGGSLWNAGIISLFMLLELFVEIVACGLVWVACLRWATISASRSAARVSWLLFTLFPIILLITPRGYLLSVQSDGERAAINAMFLMGAITILVPWALSFFPGIIRACLTCKSLMPEAAGPGWMLVCVSPLYAAVFVAAGLALLQVEQTQMVGFGVLLIAASSLAYLAFAHGLVRPLGREEAALLIQRAKRTSLGLLVAGFVLLLFAMRGLVDDLSPLRVLLTCARLWGAILLLNVVAVDLAVVLQSAAYEHAKRFQESPLRKTLDARLAAFAAVNLTSVGDDEIHAFRKVRSRVSEAMGQQRKPLQPTVEGPLLPSSKPAGPKPPGQAPPGPPLPGPKPPGPPPPSRRP